MTIVQLISPSRVSGAERYVLSLSKEQMRLGHRVVLIVDTFKGRSFIEYIKGEFLANQKSNYTNGIGEFILLEFKFGGKLNYLCYKRLKEALSCLGADVIHTHLSTANLFGILIGKKLNIGVVTTAHALSKDSIWYKYSYRFSGGGLGHGRNRHGRNGYGRNKIICVSEAVYKYLESRGIPSNNLVTILNGIKLNEVKRVSTECISRKSLKIPNENILFGVIGHLSYKKGHKHLLRAFSKVKIKNKTLLVVGEGREESRLKRESKELGIFGSVVFTGFITNVEEVFKLLDVYILPSIKGEGLPLSLLEAMNNELAIIASKISGVEEVLEDGKSGYLVLAKDEFALMEKMEILGKAECLRKHFGLNAKIQLKELKLDIESNANMVLREYIKVST